MNGFGYMVITNGGSVGAVASYSCWPGYTYLIGNASRTCLSLLVWSGRRPTCEMTCPSKVTQKCVGCKGLTDETYCLFYRTSTVATACLDKLVSATPSVAMFGSQCYEYKCKNTGTFVGVSDNNMDWTARYTCSRGSPRYKSF